MDPGTLNLNDPLVKKSVLDQGQLFLAQTGLIDFGKRVDPRFQDPKHLVYLADVLEQAEDGKIDRLAISFAPGHGKSTLLQKFTSFFLGRRPTRRILFLSANESLARRNSRYTRSLVQDPRWPWPEVKLVGESLEEWYTPQDGGVRAIGQTGVVTGFRAELIICDDIQPDAGSPLTRESLEVWFREVLATRLEPGGIVVIIQTRWHDDDLLGRMSLGEDADRWTFVNLPAVFSVEWDDVGNPVPIEPDAPDPLGRAPGEALWPERWPIEELIKQRKAVGPAAFEAQYQGNPVPAGGRTFKKEWFDNRYDEPPTIHSERRNVFGSIVAEKQLLVVQAIDSAWKDGPSNDYSVIATWGADDLYYYLLDIWRGRVEYSKLVPIINEQANKWQPQMIYVEEAASGFAIISTLKQETRYPIIGVPPKGTKESRAEMVTGPFAAHKVKLPKKAPWLDAWIAEHLRFPAGKHDDQVDTTSGALSQLMKSAYAQTTQQDSMSITQRLAGWFER